MSVLRISRDHFLSVYLKMKTYSGNYTVNREYCGTFRQFYDREIRNFIELLDEMNDLSCHYHGSTWGGNIPDMEYIPVGYDIPAYPSAINVPMLDCFGMLKALQCISYNIELAEIPERWKHRMPYYKRALDTLQRAIYEIMDKIIYSMPEYKEAEWCIE